MKISTRASKIKYAIRDLVVTAKQLEAKTKEPVTYLNIGDPTKRGFEVPAVMQEAIKEATQGPKSGYADSQGMLYLRTEITKLESDKGINYTTDQVLVTNGVSEGIQFVLGSFETGTEILVPGPHYPTYTGYSTFFGLKTIEYRTDETNGWQPDVDDIAKKITDDTQVILLINPNNPTGSVYDEKTVKSLLDLAGQHNLPVISDEIYDLLCFGRGRITPTAKLAKDVPVITFNGISKTLLAPGWRCGWSLLHDPEEKIHELWETMNKQSRIRLCAVGPIQHAVASVLNNPQLYEHIPTTLKALQIRIEAVEKQIKENPGLSLTKPAGAFYAFPKIEDEKFKDDWKFCLDLLKEKHVLFVPGSGFGKEYGKEHFRIVFLAPPDILSRALADVADFMSR